MERILTQEERDLLIKDICARWPYGVIAQIRRSSPNLNKPVILDLPIKGVINFASVDSVITVTEDGDIVYDLISTCKPYLRPLSSMTDEEKNELLQLMGCGTDIERVDFYISHHFDYRCLIPMGLALEAPKDMYKI